MKKKYIIRLSAQQRQRVTDLVRKGKVVAYRRTHAQILLFTDEGNWGRDCRIKRPLSALGSIIERYCGCASAVLREGLRRRWRENRAGEKERESWTAMGKRR